MRVSLLIFAVFLCGSTAALNVGKDEEIDIDVSTIRPPNNKAMPSSVVSGDGEDDDDDGSAIQGDSSASGSGEKLKTTVKPTPKTPKAVRTSATKTDDTDIYFTTKAKLTTEKPAVTTEGNDEEKETTMEPVEPTKEIKPTKEIEPTTDDDMMETDPEADGPGGDVQASIQEKKQLRVLTTEVIAAVVVGGICAIILIAFLVYRLRKRDEGSYALTDNAYNDTNKLRGDPGKEAFV